MRANQFNDNRDFITFEAVGAATCDDESVCDDYGGAVFAYDPTRIRVWLPDENNGRPYGLAIQVGDGWGKALDTLVTLNPHLCARRR